MRLVDLSSNDSLRFNKCFFGSLNGVAFEEFVLVGRFWAFRGIQTAGTLLRKQNEKNYKLISNVKDAAVTLIDRKTRRHKRTIFPYTSLFQ